MVEEDPSAVRAGGSSSPGPPFTRPAFIFAQEVGLMCKIVFA